MSDERMTWRGVLALLGGFAAIVWLCEATGVVYVP